MKDETPPVWGYDIYPGIMYVVICTMYVSYCTYKYRTVLFTVQKNNPVV
jgi:hypothetical protein